MSTRDETIIKAVDLLTSAAMDFAHASAAMDDDVIPLSEFIESEAAFNAMKAQLLALIAPPAPGEVRLTLSREDAEWWRNVIDKADCWGSEHEAARVLDVLTAALDAAAAPEQSR